MIDVLNCSDLCIYRIKKTSEVAESVVKGAENRIGDSSSVPSTSAAQVDKVDTDKLHFYNIPHSLFNA